MSAACPGRSKAKKHRWRTTYFPHDPLFRECKKCGKRQRLSLAPSPADYWYWRLRLAPPPDDYWLDLPNPNAAPEDRKGMA